ncbi:hypothetical protein JCM8208_006075 [Rhodotorula glutinis]
MARPKQTGARKATQYRAKAIAQEQAFDPRKSRSTAQYDTYDSVMDGDEDQFHLNRDKLLLDDGLSRSRHNNNNDDDDDALDIPDTVYDLDLPSASDSDDDDLAQEDHDDLDDDLPTKRARKDYKRPDRDDKTKGRYGHAVDPKQDVVFPSSDDESGSDDDDADADALDTAQLESNLSSDDELSSRRKKGGANSDSDDEDEDRWAAGHYHVSRRAPGEADSSDDEALELEEHEARRLQRRARERMSGADFGFDEDEGEDEGGAGARGDERLVLDDDEDEGDEAGQLGAAAVGKQAQAGTVDASHLGEAEAIAHLLQTQPETLALVDDFVLTASKVRQVASDLEVVRRGDGKGGEHPALAIMELEHQALTTYLPTLAFYFSLLVAPSPPPPALVEKVLARLSSLRERLATMEELDLTSTTYGAEDEDEDEDEDDEDDEGEEVRAPTKGRQGRDLLASEAMDFHASLEGDSDGSGSSGEDDDDDEGEEVTDSMLAGLDDDELEALMGELGPGDGAAELMRRVRSRQAEKGVVVVEGEGEGGEDEEMLDEEEEDSAEEQERARIEAARRAKKEAKRLGKGKGGSTSSSGTGVVPALAPLARTKPSPSPSTTTPRPSSSSSSSRAASAASDLLDPLALSASDRADKASSRHTLRFHVSQVAQKAARREARRTGLEGDDDVPRRSKEQARREVLKRQEHGAAKDAKERAALDGGEFDEDDRRAAKAVRGDAAVEAGEEGAGGDADDDYYDLVAAEKDEGRRAKKAKYDDERAAEKAEIESLAASSVDGPRGASRMIMANKGLTPKRKKENRNARVKKRRQYDDKKKKLRSMQATYGGGEARTGYEGEKSGISRATVKSIKLG